MNLPNLVGENDTPDRNEQVPDVEFSFLLHVSTLGGSRQLPGSKPNRLTPGRCVLFELRRDRRRAGAVFDALSNQSLPQVIGIDRQGFADVDERKYRSLVCAALDPVQCVGEIAPLAASAAAQVRHQRGDRVLEDRPHEP